MYKLRKKSLPKFTQANIFYRGLRVKVLVKALYAKNIYFLKSLKYKNELHQWKELEKLAGKMVWFNMIVCIVPEILRFENHEKGQKVLSQHLSREF